MPKGTIADLVLPDADPLNDIHNTTKISGVFLAGKEFDRAALDQDVEKRGGRRELPSGRRGERNRGRN